MKNKRKIWIIGILCLAINAVSVYFFINRNSFGNFTRVASYDDLYSPVHNTSAELNKWKKVLRQYPKDQLKEAQKLTETYAGVKEQDPTLTKIIKIGSWLRRSFSKSEIGKPSDSFEKLSDIEQYKAAARAESPVWCGTYGSQFLFFCSANNITSRCIESKGVADNHIVNESFIPELNQWVFSDLLNNVLYCKDSNNKIVNTIDLLYRNSQKDTAAFIAYEQAGYDNMLVLPRKEYSRLWSTYLNADSKLYFYYTTDLKCVYNFTQKTIRYIYPKTWFELFSLTSVSNMTFYFRILFLYTGIVLFLIFIPLYLKRK
ncbi:MAG TPA: hypothetical protein VJU78_01385 [Chitinophagaceae bacterium]|nr:hypothetical protein [Chitinophagaceae bacterium]